MASFSTSVKTQPGLGFNLTMLQPLSTIPCCYERALVDMPDFFKGKTPTIEVREWLFFLRALSQSLRDPISKPTATPTTLLGLGASRLC